jgi:acyl-CoA thioester hydrolase
MNLKPQTSNFKLTPIQIRFADVDKLGHVNNAMYLSYIELARLDFFTAVAGKINWETEGIILARVEIDYKIPVLLEDKLYVKTWCSRLGSKSFDLTYSIFTKNNGEEMEKAIAVSVLVCYNYAEGKSMTMPEQWRKWLE